MRGARSAEQWFADSLERPAPRLSGDRHAARALETDALHRARSARRAPRGSIRSTHPIAPRDLEVIDVQRACGLEAQPKLNATVSAATGGVVKDCRTQVPSATAVNRTPRRRPRATFDGRPRTRAGSPYADRSRHARTWPRTDLARPLGLLDALGGDAHDDHDHSSHHARDGSPMISTSVRAPMARTVRPA